MSDAEHKRAGSARNERHKLVLAWLLGLLAVLLVFNVWIASHNAGISQEKKDQFHHFLAQFDRAMTSGESIQRCVQAPDMPGSTWNVDTTKAYCALMNHPSLTFAQISDLLDHGKAAELDQRLAADFQAQNGPSHQWGVFDRNFDTAGFFDVDPHARIEIESWKQQSPQSPYAWLASGMEYYAAAKDIRGDGFYDGLSPDQIAGMQAQLTLAYADIEHALTLEPRLTEAYSLLIYAGNMGGSDDIVLRAAQAGLRKDPANFELRSSMIDAAQEKWGDYFGGVMVQRREVMALANRDPLLRIVSGEALVNPLCCSHDELINQAAINATLRVNLSAQNLSYLASKAYLKGYKQLAVELYSEAIRFDPLDADSLYWRDQALLGMGEGDAAIEYMTLLARHYPQNDIVESELGQLYALTGNALGAEKIFLTVLARNPNFEKALSRLGDLYNHGAHQPEKARLIADKLVALYPDLSDGYVIRACYLMDNNLPGRYQTIHYILDHFGDENSMQGTNAELRNYLRAHPETVGHD